MYIHYYLNSSLTVVKISGSTQSDCVLPKLILGYPLESSSCVIFEKVRQLIRRNKVHSANFSNETPVYNLGFFEVSSAGEVSYYKLLQLTNTGDEGIVYLLEYSTVADIFTIGLIDKEVIESIEISRFKDIIKLSSIGVLQVNNDWKTLYASKSWSELTGYSLTDIAGREWTQIIHHEDRNHFLETMHKHTEMEKNSEQDIRIIRGNGDTKWYNVHYRVSYDTLNSCSSIILVFLDVNSKLQRQTYLERIAMTDGLTKLNNRYAFQEELEKYICQLHANKTFYLLYIDLDGFKSVNDAYGHVVGDKLLCETAKRIQSSAGKRSFVARLGGDEFAILRTQEFSPEIEGYVTSLLELISKPYFLLENAHESYVSASVGIVTVKPSDIRYEDTLSKNKVVSISARLLREADDAMYRAKSSGKNTYRLYSGSIDQAIVQQQMLSDALHKALDHEEFRLHYQPQWDIQSDTPYGYEALIRWKNDGKEVSPASFIPVMEGNGMMSRLGCWLFEKALSDHEKIVRHCSSVPQLSVNFSPIQFRDHKLCSFIESTLNRYDVPAKSVTIEITESLLISDQTQTKKQLEYLKTLGLKIALDDFGTGYSSLSNLHTFPIDIIKVDQTFTRNLDVFETRQVVRAIIRMSDELDKQILFEGVETNKQLKFIQAQGVKLIQGWLISKAVPVNQIIQLIISKKELAWH